MGMTGQINLTKFIEQILVIHDLQMLHEIWFFTVRLDESNNKVRFYYQMLEPK